MRALSGRDVRLRDGELLRRREVNRDYLMLLKNEHLLLNYRLEAGRYTAPFLPEGIHGGWESPTCQLRGHFTGHWLSAAALHYHGTGDAEMKAKADAMLDELAACQKENGGEWAASIPEKYLHWIARGRFIWAPQYTIHKTFMGLLDMAQYAGSSKALEIAEAFAQWFLRWSKTFTREAFDDILDFETGGMLEVWAQLYELTGNEAYLPLLEAYDRRRLFDALLEGHDVLTNMHANTTIPEAIGCARAYEVTGEKHWRDKAEAYWHCAVTQRGQYATGGQTCGEIWTPMQDMHARLGDKNQELCTVYNLMRLADYMFRWTGDAAYADYREQNLYNGIMAQSYGRGYQPGGTKKGLITYFLPLMPGAVKNWASEKHDFFCCHGTSVQANALMHYGLYYQTGPSNPAGDSNPPEDSLYICQYFDSEVHFQVNGQPVTLRQKRNPMSGGIQAVREHKPQYRSHPDCLSVGFTLSTETPVRLALHLRIPYWVERAVSIHVNGEAVSPVSIQNGFAVLERVWQNDDQINIELPKTVRVCPLPGSEELAAFQYGPLTLAGLCDEERAITARNGKPEDMLVHDNEREWGSWKDTFKLTGQDKALRFIPLHEVSEERYTVYFNMNAGRS